MAEPRRQRGGRRGGRQPHARPRQAAHVQRQPPHLRVAMPLAHFFASDATVATEAARALAEFPSVVARCGTGKPYEDVMVGGWAHRATFDRKPWRVQPVDLPPLNIHAHQEQIIDWVLKAQVVLARESGLTDVSEESFGVPRDDGRSGMNHSQRSAV